MHLLTDSPGLALVRLYIAAPASLSAIETVPAVIVLPALVVVLLKAPNTPIAARLPSAPTQSAVSRTLVVVFIWVPPFGGWFTRSWPWPQAVDRSRLSEARRAGV